MIRKGLGAGKGSGYFNITPIDSHIHSLSARKIKSVVRDKEFNGKLTLSVLNNKKYNDLLWIAMNDLAISQIDYAEFHKTWDNLYFKRKGITADKLKSMERDDLINFIREFQMEKLRQKNKNNYIYPSLFIYK